MWLAPLRLMSQVEQINTEEMGKTQFYASFVNSIGKKGIFNLILLSTN